MFVVAMSKPPVTCINVTQGEVFLNRVFMWGMEYGILWGSLCGKIILGLKSGIFEKPT